MVALAALCAGLLVGRLRPGWRAASRHLDRWVIRVALPALILAEIPDLEASTQILVAPGMAWFVVGAGALIVGVVARRRRWPRATVGALLLVVPLGNTSFLGIPAVEALLGRDHVPAALAYDQLGSFLALTIYGALVVARFGGAAWSWSGFATRLVSFTPFLALVAAVIVRAVGGLPDGVDAALALCGTSVGPAALASLGLRLHLGSGSRRALVAFALAVRLVVLPVLALGVAVLVGDVTSVVWQASLLEAAMPPMVTAGIVATRAGLDPELATSVVGWGTVLGLVTVGLWGIVLA